MTIRRGGRNDHQEKRQVQGNNKIEKNPPITRTGKHERDQGEVQRSRPEMAP